MQVKGLGDKYWAGWVRVKEAEFLKESDFKSLVSIKDFKSLIDYISKFYKGLTVENWRKYFQTFLEIIDVIVEQRFDKEVLEYLKDEKWSLLSERFSDNIFLNNFFHFLENLKKQDNKDFEYERKIVMFIKDKYSEIFSKIEGKELFIMFYLYKKYELRILWSIFLSVEHGFGVESFKKEICLI